MALSISFRRRANACITIYNKYADPTTHLEKWQRTQIVNPDNSANSVIWSAQKAVNVRNTGLSEADKVGITIPANIGANYLEPVVWQALTSKTGKWTIQNGDIVVKGLVTDEIVTGFTMTMLKAKYENVLKVTMVDLVDQGRASFQHWQVGAN